MSLLSFPKEIVLQIVCNLHTKDILSVSLTCKEHYEVCQLDRVWQARCLNEYNVRIPAAKAKHFLKTGDDCLNNCN